MTGTPGTAAGPAGAVRIVVADDHQVVRAGFAGLLGTQQDFTVQRCPVNRRVHDLKRFVTVRGGVYLFFPSITAIKYLATI